MEKSNVTGVCVPKKHYMVDMSSRLEEVEHMIEEGKYFTVNRVRQYGKTTMLHLLNRRLREKYLVLSLSFEASDEYFASLYAFAKGFSMDVCDALEKEDVSEDVFAGMEAINRSRFPD